MASLSAIFPLFEYLSQVAYPFAALEVLVFVALGVDPNTTFRMFPQPGTYPDYYPLWMPYCFALYVVLRTPSLVTGDMETPRPLGMLLFPLTSRVSRRVALCIMLARIWVYLACVNATMDQFLQGDVRQLVFACLKMQLAVFLV